MWTPLIVWTQIVFYTTALTGVNFIPQNEFYNTYSVWALSFSIDLGPFYDNLENINRTMSTLRYTVDSELDTHIARVREQVSEDNSTLPYGLDNLVVVIKTELGSIIRACEIPTFASIVRLKSTLDQIREMYTRDDENRARRSLLPWVGSILGSLFGTATTSDMRRLKSKLNSLTGQQDELVHIVSNSLTLINKTNAVAAQNRHAINSLNGATRKLNRRVNALQDMIVSHQAIQDLKLQLNNRVYGVTNAIDRSIRQITPLIDELKRNLDQALNNQLSSNLVEPAQLRKVLSGIARRIPDSLTVKEFDGAEVMWYYKHLPLTVIPDSDRIHLISVIPLIPIESLFTLYRVAVLPIPVLNTNHSTKMTVEGTHFAVSRHGNSYVILDEDELNICMKADMTYCPLNRAAMDLVRMPSCLGSLYLGEQKSIQQNCPIKVLDTVQFPVFRHLIHGKWMIATRTSLAIHASGDHEDASSTLLTIEPPLQTITLPSGSAGYTPYATLSPYFYKSSSDNEMNKYYGRLNIGSKLEHIWDTINSSYLYDYQLRNPNPLVLDDLDDAESLNIEIDQTKLNDLKKRILEVSNSDSTHEIIISVSSILAVGILIAGIVLAIKYWQKNNHRKESVVKRSNKKIYKDIEVKYESDKDRVKFDSGRVVSSERNKPAKEQEPALVAALRTRQGPLE